MPTKRITYKSYFELTEHNRVQISIFILLSVVSVFMVYVFMLPMFESFFKDFLHGKIYNSGEKVSYTMDSLEPLQTTSYFFSWAVDIYSKTADEARFWFNPFLSLFLLASVAGMGLSVTISSLLPQSLGYMRQKIEREIMNEIDKIALIVNGHHEDEDYNDLIHKIIRADLRDLHRFVEEWGISLEDLKTIHRAIRWRVSSFWYRLIHLNDGIRMYMRFYFTVQYSNTVLGFVYIGAAILIIIIGLRGLKFIPPTQPSLVLFALGLEFSLLITYAVTLMYGRQEEENEIREPVRNSDSAFLGSDYGSSREIEKLLKVFISTGEKKRKGS
jgi:hypothetical protein